MGILERIKDIELEISRTQVSLVANMKQAVFNLLNLAIMDVP